MKSIEEMNEANEIGWWSNWAEVTWLSKECYYFISHTFNEPLFNRCRLKRVTNIEQTLTDVEKLYHDKGLEVSFFIKNSPDYEDVHSALMRMQYSVIDRFHILTLKEPRFRTNVKVECRILEDDDLELWCRTYLLSFYGDLLLLDEVYKCVKRAFLAGNNTFILAELNNEAAGTLAIHNSAGLLGVYCVGTVDKFRRKGVASTLLDFASNLSVDVGNDLVLQTFESDSVVEFYRKRGFTNLYTESVYSKMGALQMGGMHGKS